MIEGLRLWAREIIVVLTLAGALEMILPDTDVKRYARVALGFFVVLAVGRPILGLFGGGLLFDQNLSGLASWGLGLAPAAGPAASGDPLAKGEALRRASQERALAAYRAALETQFAALAARDPDVADAEAEVALIDDASSPGYGNLLAVRLRVWMAPGAGDKPGVGEPPAGQAGAGAGSGPPGTTVAPVVINVRPVIVAGGGTAEEGGGVSGVGDQASGTAPAAVETGSGDGGAAGTPAGELARRLRSAIVLLVGVPPGGVTVEVWPAPG